MYGLKPGEFNAYTNLLRVNTSSSQELLRIQI